MQTLDTLSLMLGTAWASGINLYAAVLMLGYMGMTDQINLPPELQLLANPLVFGAAGIMYAIEFFADKVPGVDSGWDLLHTFIRIPAGALLAAGAVSGMDLSPAADLAAALVGGGLAADSHLTKAGTRALINSSPEPVSNWSASITEDLVVIGGLWTSLNHPLLFLLLLLLFLLLTAWALPRIWRAIKGLFRGLGQMFKHRRRTTETPATTPKLGKDDPGDQA